MVVMTKHCMHCNIRMDINSKPKTNQKFCSKRCRKNYHRKEKGLKTRLEKRRANLRLNPEVRYLVAQCKRAKTVQILQGHTLASFTETMDLLKDRPKGDVELCHIAPVKGKNRIGLFHCRNLFYGGAYQNRKLGKKYIAGGMSIRHEDLLPQWEVQEEMKSDEVLVKIEEYLVDVITQYLEIRPVRIDRKVSVVNKILGIDASLDFDTLIRRSHKFLIEQWANITHTRPYIKNPNRESKYLAYMDSLTRFIEYNNKSRKVLKSIRKTMVVGYMALERTKQSNTYNKLFYVKYEPLINLKYCQAMLKNPQSWPVFKDIIYETAFNVLHGGEIDSKKFRRQIFSYLRFPDRACAIC